MVISFLEKRPQIHADGRGFFGFGVLGVLVVKKELFAVESPVETA
jgi:hypothetical protein